MWQKQNLCKEYQSLVNQFRDYASTLKGYSTSFRDSEGTISGSQPGKLLTKYVEYFLMTERDLNFLGYIEHVEKTPLEQADAGHIYQYMQYLKNHLKEDTELWVERVLELMFHPYGHLITLNVFLNNLPGYVPLIAIHDMFLNFLYRDGFCPGGMGEQQVKLATSPCDAVRIIA